jgi:hypothetical protein
LAANAQARYEARVADYNRELESRKAADALERGNIEVRNAARRQSQIIGAQRAAMAANGIDVSFGTASDLLADTAVAAQEERLTLRENTRREMMGFDINAANFGSQAIAARNRGSAALVSGALQLGSTIAGGAQRYGKVQYDKKFGTGTGWGGM